MDIQITNEIISNFAPHHWNRTNREYIGWCRHLKNRRGQDIEYYVEVWNPSIKIDKKPSPRTHIISSIKGITSTHEYSLETLKFLLNALDRSYK